MMWIYQKFISVLPFVYLSYELGMDGPLGPMGFTGKTSLSALLVVTLSILFDGVSGASQQEVDQHLEMGKKMLSQGQLGDALSHYHAAVDGDPTNYMTFYRRATVYLAMGKSKSALPDLDKVLQLKPDFTSARLQRGNVRLKQGKLKDALVDYESVVLKEPNNEEAKNHIVQVTPLAHSIEEAKLFIETGQNYQDAIDILTPIIEICPWDPELRELRAQCYMALGDLFRAIGDLRTTTKLIPDNTAGYYKISQLHYKMGEAEESLTEIRECLKLDPDHKECYPHYKKVKKFVKQMGSVRDFMQEQRWDDCIAKAGQMLQIEPDIFTYKHRAHGHICHCQSKAGRFQEAMAACKVVLDHDENNWESLCDRAEAYILNEMYQEAVDDYKKAQSVNGDLQRIVEGLKRAEKLLKQSLKRDYYKILGVKRNASKKEIMKTYRKLAAEWHPDKYEGEDKKKAEQKFIDIAAAKEVLSDKEMRTKFDNGEDPLDPEAQQNQHHHHGQPFFFNQGGGFKFHFN